MIILSESIGNYSLHFYLLIFERELTLFKFKLNLENCKILTSYTGNYCRLLNFKDIKYYINKLLIFF